MMSAPILLVLRLVLVLVLYAFLAWALYLLWLDLKRQSKLVASPLAPALTLRQAVDGQAQDHRFTSTEISIGRDPASDCYMEDKTISAQHARLAYHHGQWWVEDLRSTNGTFLNQEPVSEPMVITSGDVVRCGQVAFEVLIGEDLNGRIDIPRIDNP